MTDSERSDTAQAIDNGGIWLAYHSDWSGFAMFGVELDALRYAVDRNMLVQWVPTGVDVREHLTARSSR